jgi:3D-(3,5/4)-trihydroxycyclohexane-1,2-dione acylhydrolase (decyclizing)
MRNKFGRLTTGHVLVRFIARQFFERDGRQKRSIEGNWSVFGRGNVAGLGQEIMEFGQAEGLRYHRLQHEQAAEVSAEAKTRKTRANDEKATVKLRPVFV